MGSPPPRPLATVMASGRMPERCQPHQSPVRPMPHWISSKISIAPCSSQAVRAAASVASARGWMPPSPCTGSIRTAAVFWSTAAASASASSWGTTLKPGTSGANGACLASCGVADSAPMVRPWKPRSMTTNSPPGRLRRASLIAHSIASVPELQKNALPPRPRSDSRPASRMDGSV